MPLCAQCDRPLHPFLLATLFTGLVTYLSWSALGLMSISPAQRLSGALATFVVVMAVLFAAVIRCLQRHCWDKQDITQGPP